MTDGWGSKWPILTLAFGLLMLPDGAAAAINAEDYRRCLADARSDPASSFAEAVRWIEAGEGGPAEHCAAVSEIGLGRFADAAERLETLAADIAPEQENLKVEALSQAGQAWLLAGETAFALRAQNAALDLAPDDAEIRIDRALTLASGEQYWEAIDDLNAAEDLVGQRADLLVFRASAYRYVEAPELALEDLGRALELDDSLPEAYLERGIVHRLMGDNLSARDDWLKVLELAADGPAAKAARANLAKIDGN